MDTTGGEIILSDLMAWEPRLIAVSPSTDSAAWQRDVEWVTTARANAPMLPSVRGGELVILPGRIVQETGIPFSRLVTEMMLHPIAGILTDEPIPDLQVARIPVLAMAKIDPDTEGELNRLLSSRRRSLLSIVTEVDRLLADAQGERPALVLDRLATLIGIPLSIVDADGVTVLIATGSGAIDLDRREPEWLTTALRSGKRLLMGPIPPDARARARMTLGHIHDGMQRILDREASTIPRGTARTAALQSLLVPEHPARPESLADAAYHAGIAPGRLLHVVLTPQEQTSHQLRRVVSPLGEILDAGIVDGLTALVTVASPTGTRIVTPTDDHPGGWIAISGGATAARSLPEATRQARYLARLLQNGLLAGPVARFEDDTGLGLFRVLYPQWGSVELERYRSSLLGGLRREDRHGALTETLRVFLEEGGSLRPTAERLGIHRNTLAYRLRQIRQALGVDLGSPQGRLALQVALVADSLPEAPR